MVDDPIDSLALWLHWTAQSAGRAALLGDLIRTVVREANEIHAPAPGADDDPADIPALMARFAAK